MTQWIDDPDGGRDRGPRAVARAWFEVLTAPRRFFQAGVAPADQAPGLFFLMGVVLFAEGGRYVLADAAPAVGSHPIAGPVLALSLTVILLAPVALHLLVALQVLVLRALVPDRAGVSETVQVLAYASAPCVVAGVPVPAVRLLCTVYGFVLLVVGLAVVHETSYRRAAVAAIPTAAVGFGYGFRGFEAANTILGSSVELLAF